MQSRRAVPVIVTVTFVIWMGGRATAIALPLVALEQTGHAWTTGLVLGTQALPLVTVGWWGASLRERITTGCRIAVVMAVKTLGLAVVPVSAATGNLTVTALLACGLVVGATSAVDGPAIRALLSDMGDALGPGRAARALTWQDLAHRCTMFLAPPLGALAVGHGRTMELLWSECVAVTLGALLLAGVPGTADTHSPDADTALPGGSIVATLRRHPRMTASMAVHATVSLTWFAFSLGLAIAGARSGRPGELIAAGMAGYGLASTLTSFAAPVLVNRLPAWPTAVLPAAALGAAFLALPSQLSSVPGIVLLAAAGGLAMPLGIGAHNRILATEPSPGPDRRAAFAADQVADGGAAAVGMLGGGAVIGAIGPQATLTASGLVLVAAVVVSLAVARRVRTVSRPRTTAWSRRPRCHPSSPC